MQLHAMNPKGLFQKGINIGFFFFHFMSLVQLMLHNIKVLKKKVYYKPTLPCPL